MKVKKLIEILKKFNQEGEVGFHDWVGSFEGLEEGEISEEMGIYKGQVLIINK